jgi:WD40 repeat protein
VAFSPDGTLLVSGSNNGNLKIWELATARPVQSLTSQSGAVFSNCFSPDGRYLAYCGGDATVRVWDLETGVNRMTFRVAVGGELQVWDAVSGVLKQQRVLLMCEELITPAKLAAFSPGGWRLAGRARADKTLVTIWDVASGEEVLTCRGHTLPVLAIAFSGDGKRLVTCASATGADRAHEIKVWDALTGRELANLTGQGALVSAAFSPDGRWLALGGQDGTLLLADWAASKNSARLAGHKGYVAAVAFSRNGQLLASAGVDDRQLKIWVLDGFDPASVLEPAKVHTLIAPPHLCDLGFTADNRRLVGISRDVVKMWDVGTRQEVLSLRGAPQRHWDPAFNPRVAFSGDGKRLAGTNWNESISMWDASDGGDDDALVRRQLARQRAADARAVFWHLEEAEDCLEHHNLSAARFHFQRLGDTPLPGPLQARREQLAKELRK